MGKSGTDVAREAADLVLLDDDFATIVAAVEQGRSTFANIRRFLTYHLTDNVAELAPFVVWALSGGAFPLAIGVLQVLALDIGTDVQHDFRQVIHDDLGGGSYLIGDQDAGIAVVDPKLDIEEYLALAHYTGVRIEHVVEIHNQDRSAASRAQLAMAATQTMPRRPCRPRAGDRSFRAGEDRPAALVQVAFGERQRFMDAQRRAGTTIRPLR